jgi:hypothetical protein
MWYPVSKLPNFNGKVSVKIVKNGVETIMCCWYETGNRRFPQGFSLLDPKLIPYVTEWEEEYKDLRETKF